MKSKYLSNFFLIALGKARRFGGRGVMTVMILRLAQATHKPTEVGIMKEYLKKREFMTILFSECNHLMDV